MRTPETKVRTHGRPTATNSGPVTYGVLACDRLMPNVLGGERYLIATFDERDPAIAYRNAKNNPRNRRWIYEFCFVGPARYNAAPPQQHTPLFGW